MKNTTVKQLAKKTNLKAQNVNKRDARSSDVNGGKTNSGKASKAEPNGNRLTWHPYPNLMLTSKSHM